MTSRVWQTLGHILHYLLWYWILLIGITLGNRQQLILLTLKNILFFSSCPQPREHSGCLSPVMPHGGGIWRGAPTGAALIWVQQEVAWGTSFPAVWLPIGVVPLVHVTAFTEQMERSPLSSLLIYTHTHTHMLPALIPPHVTGSSDSGWQGRPHNGEESSYNVDVTCWVVIPLHKVKLSLSYLCLFCFQGRQGHTVSYSRGGLFIWMMCPLGIETFRWYWEPLWAWKAIDQ